MITVGALLRWDQPNDGVLPAAAFIDIASRSGLIVTIGRWVITQACRQMATWQHELAGAAPATVYVNLSARELADQQLPQTNATALADTCGRVTSASRSSRTTSPTPAPCSGSTSCTPVDTCCPWMTSGPVTRRCPGCSTSPSTAKIDKPFVAGLPEQDRSTRLVDGVLRLAGTLDLQVIAEGVETSAQADHLTRAGSSCSRATTSPDPDPPNNSPPGWR